MTTLKEQIECVERELEKRRRLYPRWIREGKLNELKATREIESMNAVLGTLNTLRQPDLIVNNPVNNPETS